MPGLKKRHPDYSGKKEIHMQICKPMAGVAVLVMVGVMACGAQEKKAADSSAAAAQQAPSVLMVSTNAGTLGGGTKAMPFSAEMSAEFMKKVMETTARLEEVKKQIAARQAELYASNPQVKAYRDELIKMQAQINALLVEDKELNELKMNRDILGTTAPAFPKAPAGGVPGRGMIMR
jgi:hypothetical protein